jgi:hypothetical protein
MSLLIVYLALMITGDIAAYLIGLVIERSAPAASLPGLPGDVFCVSVGRLDHCGPDYGSEGAAPIGPAPPRFGLRDRPKDHPPRPAPVRHRTGTWCGKKTY